MSLTGTLSNALSGLTASSRNVEIVSSNIANARTEGYAARELELAARVVGGNGGGVAMAGVTRREDPALIAERRAASGDRATAAPLAEYLAGLEREIGEPGQAGALGEAYSRFATALTAAESRPDSSPRLAEVLDAARTLAEKINGLGRHVQSRREAAEATIAGDVARLNEGLAEVARLNAEIMRFSGGGDASALFDRRRSVIDEINEIVPVREVPRQHGQVALLSPGGAQLVDGTAASFEFQPAGLIVPEMTLASTGLAPLTRDGVPVATGPGGPLAGGRLAAAFATRDVHAPASQARLDALARDLVERFEATAADPSRAPGAPGLFTDAGDPLDPATETGLAGRLAINALADPGQGGALWRLRDGLGATVPGAAGNPAGLMALSAALDAPRVPGSGDFAGTARSAGGLASDLLSAVSRDRLAADRALATATARDGGLRELELAQGVDTDAELQTLLRVEQAYAANAKVIQTVEDLLDLLMRL